MKGSAFATFALGFVAGGVLAGGVLYWKQIQAVYRNKDKISTGANLVTDALALKKQLLG